MTVSNSKSHSFSKGKEPINQLDSLVQVTSQDEQVLESKKSFETANDSEQMIANLAAKEKVKDSPEEPPASPKSTQQLSEEASKELQGEEKAMKNEIREIQQNEQEDKAESNKQEEDDPLAPEIILTKHQVPITNVNDVVNSIVQSSNQTQNSQQIHVTKHIVPKQKIQIAQKPSREEALADEMDKEDAQEGEVIGQSKVKSSKSQQEIEEAQGATAFTQQQNIKFDSEQAKFDKIQEAQDRIQAKQLEKESQELKTKKLQVQTVAIKEQVKENTQTIDNQLDVTTKQLDSPQKLQEQPQKNIETPTKKDEQSQKSEQESDIDDDAENQKMLKNLGATIKTDEEIQQLNIKKLEDENHSQKQGIQGLNVSEEIQKLKAGTYDNILMSGHTIENSQPDVSPSMVSVSSELNYWNNQVNEQHELFKRPHVTPNAENIKQSQDPQTYYSLQNHNHSDTAPRDDTKIGIQVQDIAQGIVENLSQNLSDKSEQQEQKKEPKQIQKSQDKQQVKKENIPQVQQQQKTAIKQDKKIQSKVEAKKVEQKSKSQVAKPVKNDIAKEQAKQLANDSKQEVVIKVDKIESVDQAAGGFIKKYAEAQLEKQQTLMLEQNQVLQQMENQFIRKQIQKVQDKPQGLFARMQQKQSEDAEVSHDAKEFADNLTQQTKAILTANNYADVIKATL